jgi:Bacterial Ig domain/Lysyl oxidase
MPYLICRFFSVLNFNPTGFAPFDATSSRGRDRLWSGPGRTLHLALCCLAMASISLTASAQGTFTNSGTLSVTRNGTNLVFNYSTTTTQGYVTLLTAGDLGTLSASPQAVNYAAVPPSKQGQFVVPMNPNATTKYFRLLCEQWPTYYLNYPDLSDIIPPAQISIVGTGTNRVFQYTHDTYNGGPGPLEIQPVYNTNSGNYLGYQHVYFFHSNTWTLAKTIPVAGAFVFDVAHGHFHFPFAAYGLYSSMPDGSIGSLLIPSPKDGFCIGDSYLYNKSLTNAGVFGYVAACSDPNTLRGLSIGCVDEYDQSDEGQSIPIPNLTNGIYWLKSMVDPFNYLAESNETNNMTEVKLSISNSTVTVLQTVNPILTPPPVITLTLPGSTNLSGTVQLTANTSVTNGSGVQFLVDGLPFGNVVSNPPYVLSWDTASVLNGTHWLAAQVADSTGHYGSSPVKLVTITNVSTIPPVVQITDPESNSTVSAVITVAVTAAAQVGIPTVQFYVDNTPLGAPVTAPPFMTTWNTEASTAGLHVLTASAVDQNSLSNSAAPVSVSVDNSHPPNMIGIDTNVFRDGTNVLQTPAFSTTTTSDLLVAFVAYDGPSNGPQTATVSGGGVNWLLAKRSNTQHGTAEIWVAKATDFLTSVNVLSQPGVAGYDGSLTVIAFTNAAGPGVVGQASAPTGAPDIYIPGVLTGNWVFAVGNDWDHATARVPVSGQVLVHQKLDTVAGDTYWVQSTTVPSVADGLVDIHDNSPTNDEWNYCAVEVVATRQ